MSLFDSQHNFGSVLILGAGKTALATARYLASSRRSQVARVVVYAGMGSVSQSVKDQIRSYGAKLVMGTEKVEGTYDICISSPGISEFSDFFLSAKAASKKIVSEPEFAYEVSPERWCAITGTNGKTTTTTLTTKIINDAGIVGYPVGNIGNLCVDALEDREEGSWFIAELSSYQLAVSPHLHPKISCLLNITPDHLSWHRSAEAYQKAKEQIFANMDKTDLCIITWDGVCADIAQDLIKRGLRVAVVDVHVDHGFENCAFVRDNMLIVRLSGKEIELCGLDELQVFGDHNIQDVLAASVMALEAGVSRSSCIDSLKSFHALEHRIEGCGVCQGITFVNDSKATNTDAVQKALASFKPHTIVLLCGGHDKHTDLEEFAKDAVALCKSCVCFGEAGPRIAQALKDAQAMCDSDCQIIMADHMKDAIYTGFDLACENDTVLLSPACSSFDEFSCYEQRGEVFKDIVSTICATKG